MDEEVEELCGPRGRYDPMRRSQKESRVSDDAGQ